jgi:formylglycine-generating enzyme required for sulfatase activity
MTIAGIAFASGGRFPSGDRRKKHDIRVDHLPGPPSQGLRGRLPRAPPQGRAAEELQSFSRPGRIPSNLFLACHTGTQVLDELESRALKLAKELADFGTELRLAYAYSDVDPASSLTKSRIVMEKLLLEVYAKEMGHEPKKPLLGDMLADNQFTRKLERRILSRMNAIRDMGNLGPHGEAVEAIDAVNVLDNLCTILDWYLQRTGTSRSAQVVAPLSVAPTPPAGPTRTAAPRKRPLSLQISCALTIAALGAVCMLMTLGFLVATKDRGLDPTANMPDVPTRKYEGMIAAMKFVNVPRGTFWMSKDNENAQKQVTIEEDFELAAYTVTQGQWEEVMGNNPSWFSRRGNGKAKVENVSDADLQRFPVENMSWDDVQKFVTKLNEREKGKGWLYRLPKEAEWEYACRGAATSKEECSFDFYLEKPTNDLSWNQANFWSDIPGGNGAKGPKLERTTKVGSYAPNKLGLHDMHGNLWQWCEDPYDVTGSARVVRGGGWDDDGRHCRAAVRSGDAPADRGSALGFRLARVPSGSK